MSFGTYTNFIEPTQIPTNIFWMLMGIPINYLLKQLWQKHPIKLNRKTILKSYQIMKLIGRIFHFMFVAYFQSFVNKLHIKKFDEWCSKTGINDLIRGFLIFREIEPKAAEGMIIIIGKFMDQYQVNKITGLIKVPDLSGID